MRLTFFEQAQRILQETAIREKHRPIEDKLCCEYWRIYSEELTDTQCDELDLFCVYVNELNHVKNAA